MLLKQVHGFVEDRIEPELGSSRIRRVASTLKPSIRAPYRAYQKFRPKEQFTPLALARQHVSMCFDSGKDSDGWETGLSQPQCLV